MIVFLAIVALFTKCRTLSGLMFISTISASKMCSLVLLLAFFILTTRAGTLWLAAYFPGLQN